jgi:hypothetical protein
MKALTTGKKRSEKKKGKKDSTKPANLETQQRPREARCCAKQGGVATGCHD